MKNLLKISSNDFIGFGQNEEKINIEQQKTQVLENSGSRDIPGKLDKNTSIFSRLVLD